MFWEIELQQQKRRQAFIFMKISAVTFGRKEMYDKNWTRWECLAILIMFYLGPVLGTITLIIKILD